MPEGQTQIQLNEAVKIVMTAMSSEEGKPKKKKTSVPNLDVVHRGVEIILPVIDGKPMTYDEGIEWLGRKKKEDEQEVRVHHQFLCSPLDGAVAFQKALAAIYGWTQMVPTPGFFGDTPPTMVGVALSPTETLQVPLGKVDIPGIDGWLHAGVQTDPSPLFLLRGEVKKKHSQQVDKIVNMTKKFLREDSIYKGKAVKVSWQWERDEVDYDPIQHAPQFMELGGVQEEDLVFGQQVINDLNIGLFTPIEQSDACRAAGVPLKRGVLLYGPYGTGKTLTAYVSALKAIKNGWTFVYLDHVRDIKKALDFAAQYAPCVLFAEDIDRIMAGSRNTSMDEILNTLDGVDTKGAEIITVLTTNYIEDINPATLRMGRLDTLVHVTPPDQEAVQRLIRLYSRGLLDEQMDLTRVGEALEGQIPAYIRECTERAKIAAISRIGSADIKGKVLEEDLLAAAQAMQPHADLLKPREQVLDIKKYQVLVPGSSIPQLNGGTVQALN